MSTRPRAGRATRVASVAQAGAARPAAASAAPGQVRIIGGQWKRSRLPVAARPGLRPTPDRVRETLFNWLGQDLHGRHCLDAFAGSGALGLEAASRHAAQVLLVERDSGLCRQLQAHAQRLQAGNVRIQCGDGLAALRAPCAQQPQGWDVVFLDPPYAAGLDEPALQLARRALAPDGWLYWESGREWGQAELAALGWQRRHYLRAGQVHAHLLALAPAQEGA
ncbi:16S rRNA (guanine(966)-N(2))-methyltransferase RsmD [Vandammella animalimorsus]|uniref:16S rRNA (guanine(966)-N(2))-methyltransferase RsmD n=1 Tax=Vandammella animalimorsus TaxID=2029117 RepID=UPI0026AAC3F9